MRVSGSSSLAGFEFRGRGFSPQDVVLIQEVVASCGPLGRTEIAATVAELLEWERPNGKPKVRECLDLLEKLASDGVVELPGLRHTKPRGSTTRVPVTERGAEREPLVGTTRDFAPVRLELVRSKDDRLLWRELVGRYHYLGHKVPFGAHLRYLVLASRPQEAVLGCVQLSSPAWRVKVRDSWIGWDDLCRAQNLQLIINNSRFLLLPWVHVRNLASTVLATMARQIIREWQAAYGSRPLLLETFVDRQRFRGTCYRAANWTCLGSTQGRGRMDQDRSRLGAQPKDVFVYPLARNARSQLRTLPAPDRQAH
jgi:hypothetical protein